MDKLKIGYSRPIELQQEELLSVEREVGLDNVLTEKDLCEFLGMNKDQVGNLRRTKGLPYIAVNERCRLYFERDLIEFFMSRRVVKEDSVPFNGGVDEPELMSREISEGKAYSGDTRWKNVDP